MRIDGMKTGTDRPDLRGAKSGLSVFNVPFRFSGRYIQIGLYRGRL